MKKVSKHRQTGDIMKSYENIYALKIVAWDSVSDTAPTFSRRLLEYHGWH